MTYYCECTDPGCICMAECVFLGKHILHRVDMEDVTGTYMCDQCADDAMESGLFTMEDKEDEEVDDESKNG